MKKLILAALLTLTITSCSGKSGVGGGNAAVTMPNANVEGEMGKSIQERIVG